MANQIIQRTVSGEDDKRLSLSNGQAIRKLEIGTNWNKLNIGIRWSVTDGSSSLAGSPTYAVGLCNSTDESPNGFGSATTNYFAGVKAAPTTMTWFFGSLTTPSADLVYCTKVGTAISSSTVVYNSVTSMCGSGNGNSPNNSLYYLSITKGSPNWTFQSIVRNNQGCSVGYDTPYANFLSTMETPFASITSAITTISAGAGSSYYFYGNVVTMSINEAMYGNLDSINIYWNKTFPALELCDVFYAREA